MSLLREMSDSLIKYGEILIDKTEQFTRSARIRIDIRKKEIEINNIKVLIADHVITSTDQNRPVEIEFLSSRMNAIKGLNSDIEGLRIKLEEQKKQNTQTAVSTDAQNNTGSPA